MDNINLPSFPTFDVEAEKSTIGPRWDRWVGRLENLFVALKMVNPPVAEGEEANAVAIKSIDDRKRALLLHFVGDSAYDIYEAQKGQTEATYAATKKVLTDYFRPRKNTQMEIYTFRGCKQKEGQLLDEYVTELRKLSKHCEFTDVDKEILSQLIQNCRSNQLRRRALREPDKSLDDIILLGRAMEMSDSQAQVMERQSENQAPINTLQLHGRQRYRGNPRGRGQRRGGSVAQRKTQTSRNTTCYKCGGTYPHKDRPCPARNVKCHKCKRTGHFKKMCTTQNAHEVKGVAEANEASESDDDDYCYGVKLKEGGIVRSVKGPYVDVKINNANMKLLVDSGSSVNILDETGYSKVGKPKINPKQRDGGKLVPYGEGKITVLGTCNLKMETDKAYDVVRFYVVRGNSGSLLGFPTADQLNIIKVVNKVEGTDGKVEDDFPQLFHGIGKLKDRQVKIHIDTSVNPVAQKPRRTPFHLRGKVEKELDELLKLDIIEKVEGEPTPWVSPIVTPPKKDGKEIRLCVDMREANQAVKRERHTMPTIEELILDMNGAKVFSKLDLRSGYHQLELHPESRYITTFSTHKGIYRYKRLNFGISSASEIFHETIRQVIQDITGARNISDDIVVYAENREKHDAALRKVLERLQESGLTLNAKKCIFRTNRISFFGVVFGENGISPDPAKVKAVHDFDHPQNVKDLRSFLGLTNYCARFIKDYAKMCQPLRELTHKDKAWEWTDDCEKSFKMLKAKLCGDTVICYYDPSKPVSVQVDASPVGLGAVLVQETDIVCYASRAPDTGRIAIQSDRTRSVGRDLGLRTF